MMDVNILIYEYFAWRLVCKQFKKVKFMVGKILNSFRVEMILEEKAAT